MADSPVQPVVISSPVKVICHDTPTVLHNEEISELKERLKLAEKQLQNEQQLLHTVMEKVSNIEPISKWLQIIILKILDGQIQREFTRNARPRSRSIIRFN